MIEQQYVQASIEHLKYSQNGGALRARFRDGVTGSWEQGWLVGWIQGKYQWVACYDNPDNCNTAEDVTYWENHTWQYCEILASDLEAR